MNINSTNSTQWIRWSVRSRKQIKKHKIAWLSKSDSYKNNPKNLENINHLFYIDNQLKYFIERTKEDTELSAIQWTAISLLRDQLSDVFQSMNSGEQ